MKEEAAYPTAIASEGEEIAAGVLVAKNCSRYKWDEGILQDVIDPRNGRCVRRGRDGGGAGGQCSAKDVGRKEEAERERQIEERYILFKYI